jgi:hypothetical protein
MTLLKQLEQAAAHWKQSLLKVGEIMVALRKAGEPVGETVFGGVDAGGVAA